MSWQGSLALHYRQQDGRTLALDRHTGPLRVLRALYPEGPQICHHVLVHPPGGIVGGDSLQVDLHVAAGSHAVLTTPGATRFYRSSGSPAQQHVHARLAAGSRLEWLPQESIVHNGALADNTMRFELESGAQMIGWDSLALGLPASNDPFVRGRFKQEIELPGLWLERGCIDLDDAVEAPLSRRLLDSPLGWAGKRVLSTIWCASGTAWSAAELEGLLDSAREALAGTAAAEAAAYQPEPIMADGRAAGHAAGLNGYIGGASALNAQLVVVRILAERTEAPWHVMRRVRDGWRQRMWGLGAHAPRVWGT